MYFLRKLQLSSFFFQIHSWLYRNVSLIKEIGFLRITHPAQAIPRRGIPGEEGDKNTNEEVKSLLPEGYNNEPRDTTVSLREEHKDEPDHLTCKQSITLKKLCNYK